MRDLVESITGARSTDFDPNILLTAVLGMP